MIVIGLILFVACEVGKRGVFYEEMPTKPTVQIGYNMITVNTVNSSENSALSIYKIEYAINTTEKIIELRGYQALNKDLNNVFEIPIKEALGAKLDGYRYFWVDPDNTRTELDKIDVE